MPTLLLILVLILPFMISTSHYLDFEERIVNGKPISANEYPWMVSLRDEFIHPEKRILGTTGHFCGASLIETSPPIILTAAYCLQDYGLNETAGTINFYNYTVRIACDLNRTDQQRSIGPVGTPSDQYETLYVYDPNMIHIHPTYDSSAYMNGYDIALLIIDDNQTVTIDIDPVPTIQMQLEPLEKCCSIGENLTAIGYGRNATNGIQTKTLEITTLNYIDTNRCDGRPTMSHRILCTAGSNTNICQGDSGGPLFIMNGNIPEIKGVTSFTIGGCNDGSFAAFTPVGQYYNWIMKTIEYVFDGDSWNPTIDPTNDPTSAPSVSSAEGGFKDLLILIWSHFFLLCIH